MLKATRHLVFGLAIFLATSARAESVIDAHITAVGGADAIAKIKTVHRTSAVSGKSSFGPFSGTSTEIYDLSGRRAYTVVELTGFSRKSGWDATSGWIDDTQAGLRKMSKEELDAAKYDMGPSPLADIHAEYGKEVLKEGDTKEFNGRKCTVITIEGTPVEYYVNQKTKLLEGFFASDDLTVTMEDYQSVDGVQLANKRTLAVASQKLTITYEYKTTKLNGKIDATKFKNPLKKKTKPQPPADSFTAEQVISFLDKDGDGKISKSEASKELKPNFQFIDTNGDGKIDLKEAKVMMKYAAKQSGAGGKPTPKTSIAKKIIDLMDKNGDGRISKQEASEDLRLFFGNYDVNKDGSIDAKEAIAIARYVDGEEKTKPKPAPKKGGVTAKQIVGSMDKNNDNKISKDEASAQLKPYFGQFDTNKDGFIDVKRSRTPCQVR